MSSLFVDANCIGAFARCSQICPPVCASVMRPVSETRFGSAKVAASAAVKPGVLGTDAESSTGRIAGLALAGGRGGGAVALSPEVSSAAPATTTATSAMTATASIAW